MNKHTTSSKKFLPLISYRSLKIFTRRKKPLKYIGE